MLQIHQFPYGSDNYTVLLHDPDHGETACVDAGDGDVVLAALDRLGLKLTQMWFTHHHADHVSGLAQVKAATGADVYGPEGVAGIEHVLKEGQSFRFASRAVDVIATPGHTLDMLNFHLPSEDLLFRAIRSL